MPEAERIDGAEQARAFATVASDAATARIAARIGPMHGVQAEQQKASPHQISAPQPDRLWRRSTGFSEASRETRPRTVQPI